MKIPRYNKIKYFQHFDIFGNLFNFTINKQTKFKTNLGAILSLITLIVIIVTCFFFGKDFYHRTNPKVLSQKTVPEDFPKMNISSRNLTISWRIEDQYGKELDFSGILFPVFKYLNFEKNNQTKNLEFAKPQKNLKMKRCNETLIEGNFEKFHGPDQWYCIDFDTEDLLLGGNWDANYLYYFELNFIICNRDENSLRLKECADFEILKQFLNEIIYLSINFPSIYFDFTDYDNPLKIEYKVQYTHITRNLLRFDECFFNLPLINDDRGWIFEDLKINTGISLDYCEKDYHIKYDDDYIDENSNDIIYSVSFYLGKSFPFYIRSYTKFQDLAATVGGFVKLVTLFFSYINYYFNNFERDKFLIDHFFNISSEEKELKDTNLKIFEERKPIKKICLELDKYSYSNYKIEINNIEKNENEHKYSFKDFINIKTDKNIKNNNYIKKDINKYNLKKDININNRKNPNKNTRYLDKKINHNRIKVIPKIEDEYNNNSYKNVEDINNLFLSQNKENNLIINPILNNSNSNFFNISNNCIQTDVVRLPTGENSVKINHLELDDKLTIIRNNENDKEKNEIEKIENHKKCITKRKIYLLGEKTINSYNSIGFFNFYLNKLINWMKIRKKEYHLFKTIDYIKDHINDKFDLLKYYKRYIDYKYLKKVILSNQQRKLIKNICNLKLDYRMIYKNNRRDYYNEDDKDLEKLINELKDNDILDERFKELINNKLY